MGLKQRGTEIIINNASKVGCVKMEGKVRRKQKLSLYSYVENISNDKSLIHIKLKRI